MNLSAVVIMTLLIVAVIGFFMVLVLALQYYTVTKKTNELKETIYLSKLEYDYAMEQLEIQEVTHAQADSTFIPDNKRVTDQQIIEARERMLIQAGIMVDPDDNSGLFM